MRDLNVFSDGKDEKFHNESWFRENTPTEFYEKLRADVPSGYNRYADVTAIFDSLTRSYKLLLGKGVSPDDVEKLSQDTAKGYVEFADRVSVDDFLKAYEEFNGKAEKIRWHFATTDEERYKLLGLENEFRFYKALPDEYKEVLDRLNRENWVRLIHLLKGKGYCVANLSCISDKFFAVHDFTFWSEHLDPLSYALSQKIRSSWGNVLFPGHMLTRNAGKLNYNKLCWFVLQAGKVSFMLPLYCVLMPDFELPPFRGIIKDFIVGDNVIWLTAANTAGQSDDTCLPAILDLQGDCLFPAERLLEKTIEFKQLTWKMWKFLYIISEKKDWDYLFEHGGNTLAVLDYWRSGRNFNECMMDFLGYRISSDFPEGNFSYAVFSSGVKVDLREIFTGRQQEIVAELKMNGFPDCKYE